MHGCMDGWMHGWMDAWIDIKYLFPPILKSARGGCITLFKRIYIYIYIYLQVKWLLVCF